MSAKILLSLPFLLLACADRAALDVVAVSVGPAAKGEPIHLSITVENHGARAAAARFVPVLTSRRFSDFAGVELPAVEAEVAAGARVTLELEAGPFLAAAGRRWALGAGEYVVDAVHVLDDDDEVVDVDFVGGAFTIAPSHVVFTAVTYDPAYFAAIGWDGDVHDFLREAYTRPSEVFHADGSYVAFPGGFDEILGIEQQFDVVPGLAATPTGGGFCEQVARFAGDALGLADRWESDGPRGQVDPDHHGYDLLVGLTPAMGGGAACSWLGVQVSSLFAGDLSWDRAQLVLVHESGHLFGAPHCDPAEGYVMCAGERHPHYQERGVFVWHEASVAAMQNRWAD